MRRNNILERPNGRVEQCHDFLHRPVPQMIKWLVKNKDRRLVAGLKLSKGRQGTERKQYPINFGFILTLQRPAVSYLDFATLYRYMREHLRHQFAHTGNHSTSRPIVNTQKFRDRANPLPARSRRERMRVHVEYTIRAWSKWHTLPVDLVPKDTLRDTDVRRPQFRVEPTNGARQLLGAVHQWLRICHSPQQLKQMRLTRTIISKKEITPRKLHHARLDQEMVVDFD